jgi:hypothetical protein
VLQIDGWTQSYGVRAEIELCEKLGIPIRYLKPADLAASETVETCLRSAP